MMPLAVALTLLGGIAPPTRPHRPDVPLAMASDAGVDAGLRCPTWLDGYNCMLLQGRAAPECEEWFGNGFARTVQRCEAPDAGQPTEVPKPPLDTSSQATMADWIIAIASALAAIVSVISLVYQIRKP